MIKIITRDRKYIWLVRVINLCFFICQNCNIEAIIINVKIKYIRPAIDICFQFFAYKVETKTDVKALVVGILV